MTVRSICAAAALSLIVLTSCTSTKMAGSWKDDAYLGGHFKKIMVLGIARKPAVRQVFENDFVEQLKKGATEGVPSHTVFPTTEKLDRETIASKLTELGCDGILITRYVDAKTQSTYYGPKTDATPSAYYRGWDTYYEESWDSAASDDSGLENTILRFETNLYDARTGKLTWTGMTDTFVSEKPLDDIGPLITTLVEDLRKKQLIP
jgi:hypothetical protein